jgi:hypothetical protein
MKTPAIQQARTLSLLALAPWFPMSGNSLAIYVLP